MDPAAIAKTVAETHSYLMRIASLHDEWASKVRIVSFNPLIASIDSFLTDEECDRLVGLAEESGKLTPSWAHKSETCVRTSDSYHPRLEQVMWLRKKVGDLVNLDTEFHERPKVTRYLAGQEFGLHTDSYRLGKAEDEVNAWNILAGQRLVTVLIYLNTVEDGSGHTEFPALLKDGRPLGFAPVKGQAVVFFPAFRDTREPDIRVIHRSCRSEATKYVCQCWIRDRPTVIDTKEHAIALMPSILRVFHLRPELVKALQQAAVPPTKEGDGVSAEPRPETPHPGADDAGGGRVAGLAEPGEPGLDAGGVLDTAVGQA